MKEVDERKTYRDVYDEMIVIDGASEKLLSRDTRPRRLIIFKCQVASLRTRLHEFAPSRGLSDECHPIIFII